MTERGKSTGMADITEITEEPAPELGPPTDTDVDLDVEPETPGPADEQAGGAGFVAVGAAESSSSAKAMTTVAFAAGSIVTSGWNLTVDSTTNGSVNAYATGSAKGLGAGVTATATGSLTLGTQVNVAGSLIADHLLAHGDEVGHIMGMGAEGASISEAALNEGAVIGDDGLVRYPAA